MEVDRDATKRLIAGSFVRLASTRQVGSITVKDIYEGCGVSKRTFYNHFTDKYDLMRWIYLDKTHDKFAHFVSGRISHLDYTRLCLQAYRDGSVLQKNLWENTHGRDSFRLISTSAQIGLYEDLYLRLLGVDGVEPGLDFSVKFLVRGTFDAMDEWRREGFPVPAGELAALIAENVPQRLRPVLDDGERSEETAARLAACYPEYACPKD